METNEVSYNQSVIQFGTDGWRGIIDDEINEQTVAEVAQAFALFLQDKTAANNPVSVAICFDGRKNSALYARIFSEVLSGNTISVLLSDKILPTPCLSFAVVQNGCTAGVMITASHNPKEYNGIKFKSALGGPYATEDTKEVENRLFRKAVLKSNEFIEEKDFLSGYINHLQKSFKLSIIKDSGLKIGIDSMGGAGQDILEKFLAGNGIEAHTIYSTAAPDFMGRKAEPIENNLKEFSDFLSGNRKYALGVATDGDADRLGVLDENGKWVSAHETILMLAGYVHEDNQRKGNFVKTSSVTSKLFKLENPFTKVSEVQVGFKYISEKMLETDALFGCEESGGYGFKKHIPERDGIFSALVLIEALAVSGCATIGGLKEVVTSRYGKVCYDRIDRAYTGADRMEKLPAFVKSLPKQILGLEITGAETFLSSRGVINGIKLSFPALQWLLIRCSETEPMFRVYCEGSTDAEVKELLSESLKMLSI